MRLFNLRLFGFINIFIPALLAAAVPAEDRGDWPILGHDARRSGATAVEVRPPFERKWYRLFADEGLLSGVQPIIAGGSVYVGTLAGVLHAMDAATGEDRWTFKAGGPILHTAAASGDRVFFGAADGKIYAVAAGKLAWAVQTGAAVWNAPLVHDGVVIAGSRDGKLYAADAASGAVRWTADAGAPILSSPALDERSDQVYVGSEDLRVHSFGFQSGREFWRSQPLPGVSLRGYHPVVAPDGSVMVTVTPILSLDTFNPVLLDMVKEVFGDFASWRHKKDENDRLRAANFALLEKPETYAREMAYIKKRLTEEPIYQTFFVLDPTTGEQKFVTPIVYGESMNGTGAPPIVTASGKVIVKFQALLRSRYEHYSPFLNVGYLDTATGAIEPIMDQSRTYGWHDSLLLVHDEQCQLSAGGRILFNTHQDNVNALDLDTLKGYPSPLARNIHEPEAGEAAAIWALILHGKPLPEGKEWLARGTAVYGGGSVIDVPVAIAGNSFYFVPTHEISAGAAVIAYRMKSGGGTAEGVPPPAEKLTAADFEKIQEMPWDWDMLGMPRLDHPLKALPGNVPGTRQAPLREEAEAAVARVSDATLDRFIWEAPRVRVPAGAEWSALREELRRAVVGEIAFTGLRPFQFPSGKHPEEAYRLFIEPTETLYTLALAYPFLDPKAQADVKAAVSRERRPGGALEPPLGKRVHDGRGGRREAYSHSGSNVENYLAEPPRAARLLHIADEIVRDDLARLYPLWLWSHVSGEWGDLESAWPKLRDLPRRPAPRNPPDLGNSRLAGLIACCRLAHRLGDASAVEEGVQATRKALRERLAYELAHTRGGLIEKVPVGRSIFGRWHFLTPEVGRFLAAEAGEIHRHLMEVSIDRQRPTWWIAWNVETLWRNESNFALPGEALDIFSARTWILAEPAGKLRAFLDIPWCRGDEYHAQKIAMTLAMAGGIEWIDVRR